MMDLEFDRAPYVNVIVAFIPNKHIASLIFSDAMFLWVTTHLWTTKLYGSFEGFLYFEMGTVTFGSIRSYRHERIFHSEFECDAKDLALSIKNQPEEQKIYIHGLTRISFQHWKFSL